MVKQTVIYDDDGSLVRSVTRRAEGLKGEWVVVYKAALLRLSEEVPNLATIKVYMFLMYNQTYEMYVYETISGISRKLSMAYKTVWNAVDWLEVNGYLTRLRFDGNTAFLLNPSVTTCGKASLLSKKDMWTRLLVPNAVVEDNKNPSTESAEISLYDN